MNPIWWVLFLVIWVAIAFWPSQLLAVPSCRSQGTQIHRLLHLQPGLLPGRDHHGLHGAGPHTSDSGRTNLTCNPTEVPSAGASREVPDMVYRWPTASPKLHRCPEA